MSPINPRKDALGSASRMLPRQPVDHESYLRWASFESTTMLVPDGEHVFTRPFT